MKALLLALVLTVSAAAQTPARLTFDVASIRPSNPDAQGGMVKPIPGGHGYTVQNVPVKVLISLMYKVPTRQIEGGPDWLNTQRFDIEARIDGTYSVDDLHTMFQNLLTDRFGLKFHKDVREGNVYALTIDPSGLKMKPNTSPDDFEIPMQGPPAKLIGKRVYMSYLCWNLGQALQNDGRPVADETGLKGYYDFTLSFMPQFPPGFDTSQLPPEYKELPSLFDAVRQQLGLRLTAQKGPVDHFVIESIAKPTDN
jgi:uncharacterized protein (TIGR03435 family)